MAKKQLKADIEVDGKIIKKDGTGSQVLMADGSVQPLPSDDQENIVREIVINPDNLTTIDKAGVVEYLNTQGVTIGEKEIYHVTIDQSLSNALNKEITVSTSAPSGVPNDGDEWVIYDPQS